MELRSETEATPGLTRSQVYPPVVTGVRPSGGKFHTARPWELSPWPAAGGAPGGSGFLMVSTHLHHWQRSFCLKLAGCEAEG